MEIYLKDKPLVASQIIPFAETEHELKRRGNLKGAYRDRTILIWLGSNLLSSKGYKTIESDQRIEDNSISVSLYENGFRLKQLPEAWQTPSHRIYICPKFKELVHGLESIMEIIRRLEGEELDCLVSNECVWSSLAPTSIVYASPSILETITQTGFVVREETVGPREVIEKVKQTQAILKDVHDKYYRNSPDPLLQSVQL